MKQSTAMKMLYASYDLNCHVDQLLNTQHLQQQQQQHTTSLTDNTDIICTTTTLIICYNDTWYDV